MENKGAAQIYGNFADAPYLNQRLSFGARAAAFVDELPALQSEGHYILMEAGTNSFSDHTFETSDSPSMANSTNSTLHLSTQLTAAGIPWMSFQEGMQRGTCPIESIGSYAPRHNPFLFFQDVSGAPPSLTNTFCIDHHRPYQDFAASLAHGELSGYVFITPDLCHDMHGDPSCPTGIDVNANIRAGDQWLSTELPRIIDYATEHDAIVFIVFDEGDASNLIPFAAFGPRVRANTVTTVPLSHRSLVKSAEQLFGLPVLDTVVSANNFADMFLTGVFP
jgi:phosphatidylinositol-3-phosphatase